MIKNLIIAEIGSVHDGSLGNALKLIELAAKCGANAVKFQTHIAAAETIQNAPNPSYFQSEPRYKYFERTGFNFLQWCTLKEKCSECGVLFLSSPFSTEAVDLLERVGVQVYKIPSGEVTNIPLLEKISLTGKPVLLSSGMSDWNELDAAVNIFKGRCEFVVLQCSSAYPCNLENVGLNVLSEMKKRYECEVGFSDHTLGISAPLAAAALGAIVIEKHFTFHKGMYGSDAQHSMDPEEFLQLSSSLKEVWQMLNSPVDKNDISNYNEMKKIFQKSIVASRDLQENTIIKLEDITFKKPGYGISSSNYKNLIGKKLKVACLKDQLLNKEDFE
jgi:N,N'-diacetyllegionaminate synthase